MAQRGERPYTYLASTTGMCRKCRSLTTSRHVERQGEVWQENLCPACGTSSALIAESLAWYQGTVRHPVQTRPWHAPTEPVQKGCPFDCGPCAMHAGAPHLPVFSVTNACDLNCPICFTFNRADQRYDMTREELARLLDRLLERSGTLDLINITGGEPTLHPHLFDLIAEAAGRPGIGRVTVNTNGRRIAREPEFARTLADSGAYVVLSFDTLNSEASVRIHGKDLVEEKRTALKRLDQAGVGTTLLHVMIPGANDGEFGSILDLALQYESVRSITVQTMTFTGSGGGQFLPRCHLPLDRAARLIAEATDNRVPLSAFRPLPTAHGRCYQVAYFFKWNQRLYDFSTLFSAAEFASLFGDGYLMRPGNESETLFRQALDRLWAEGGDPDLLSGFKTIIRRLYPTEGPAPSLAERRRIGEQFVLTIYLHAHMDEDNFDVARVATCPDQVPDPDGNLIPACSYNLFYRMKDPRFWKTAAPQPNQEPKP